MYDGTCDEMRLRIRQLVAEHSRINLDAARLGDEADLYDAGLSSLASVNLMLALEESFDIEFPDHMLKRKTFSSVSAIHEAVRTLLQAGDAT